MNNEILILKLIKSNKTLKYVLQITVIALKKNYKSK